MEWSRDQLERVIAGESIGSTPPYDGGVFHAQIEQSLQRTVDKLAESAILEIDAEFGHYGSGYASYIDVFCYKSNGRSTVRTGNTDFIDGITVYLSRLAPLAVWGALQKTKTESGGCYAYLDASKIGTIPPGDWHNEIQHIVTVLQRRRFQIAAEADLNKPLGFPGKVKTILADPPYHVFDAFFYWED